MSLLKVEGAVVRYGGIVALHGVSIEVREGETVLLVGSNGAGKSSLINAVIGLVPLAAGRVTFRGEDLADVSRMPVAHAWASAIRPRAARCSSR